MHDCYHFYCYLLDQKKTKPFETNFNYVLMILIFSFLNKTVRRKNFFPCATCTDNSKNSIGNVVLCCRFMLKLRFQLHLFGCTCNLILLSITFVAVH